MINLELWNIRRKANKQTLTDIAEKSQISISTIKDIFRGATTDPRIETGQAIERALGLAPTFTAEEQAQGAVNSPTVLSDRDLNTLGIINRAEDVLGYECVDAYLTAIDIAVEQKLKK